MKKSVFAMIIAATFLMGGAVVNIDILAAATGGNGDGAWAKLVARVTGLEERVATLEEKPANDMLFKQIHDDAEGNALGWIPDGDPDHTQYIISDPDVKADSMVVAVVDNNGLGGTPQAFCPVIAFDGSFLLDCQFGLVADGADVKYTVISP